MPQSFAIGRGIEDSENLEEAASNTQLLLELIRLQKRANLHLAAINAQLGKNGGIDRTTLASVIDQEQNEEIY